MPEISTSSIIPDVSNLSLEEAIKSLNSSATGLSSGEAENRISQYGYNELASKTVNPILQFLSYFWNPISWMIEAAVIFPPPWVIGQILSLSLFYYWVMV